MRLEGVHAARLSADPKLVEKALTVLDKPMDSNLDFALWLTCRELADVWLPAFQKGEITFGGNVSHIAFALKAADRPGAVGALLDLVDQGRAEGERVRDLLTLVGELGSKEDLGRLTEMACRPGANAGMVDATRQALITAARQRNVRIDEARVGTLTNLAEATSPLTIRLAGVYKIENVRPQLEGLAAKGGAVTDAALEALLGLGGAKTP